MEAEKVRGLAEILTYGVPLTGHVRTPSWAALGDQLAGVLSCTLDRPICRARSPQDGVQGRNFARRGG